MQQLLSKEVLYQPMKDIASKYPEWLEKNRASLPQEELEKYEKQHSCIIEVCGIYETEPLDFDRLVIAMQEVCCTLPLPALRAIVRLCFQTILSG